MSTTRLASTTIASYLWPSCVFWFPDAPPLQIRVLVLQTRYFTLDLTLAYPLAFAFTMSSAFEASTLPSTPPRIFDTSTRTSSFEDTPWNKGSGSHSGFRNKHTQDDYKPYLKEDLERSKTSITFDEFLKHILRISPNGIIKRSLELTRSSTRNDTKICYGVTRHGSATKRNAIILSPN
jgi:hypothetical protein